MAFAHDIASLNAIATNSTVAFRSWIHENADRSDAEVSCKQAIPGEGNQGKASKKASGQSKHVRKHAS